MSDLASPKYDVDHDERAIECADRCQRALKDLILAFVEAGWREQEVAIHLADAAEEYVMYLASQPRAQAQAANTNKQSL